MRFTSIVPSLVALPAIRPAARCTGGEVLVHQRAKSVVLLFPFIVPRRSRRQELRELRSLAGFARLRLLTACAAACPCWGVSNPAHDARRTT